MTFGRHWIAAAVCLPLLGLGGCSEDPEPIIDPPVETSSAADPTPTPEAKEPWEKKTDAGAVAFAEHWFGVFSQVMDSGETDRLRALSAPTCEICEDFAGRLDQINSAGGSYEGEGWRVLQSVVSEGASGADVTLALRIHEGAERVRETASSDLERRSAARSSWAADLVWDQERWMLHDLRLLQ